VRPALASASPLGIGIYVGYPIIAVKSAVDAAHAEIFDLEELLDAVFRAPVNHQMGPMPLSFMPPNGAISVEMMPSLMPTMPYSSASATHQMRPMSRL
jgi:hypothetical protein